MGHERLETELLLAALEKRPQCVSFAGQAWEPRKMAWDFLDFKRIQDVSSRAHRQGRWMSWLLCPILYYTDYHRSKQILSRSFFAFMCWSVNTILLWLFLPSLAEVLQALFSRPGYFMSLEEAPFSSVMCQIDLTGINVRALAQLQKHKHVKTCQKIFLKNHALKH